ncbi:hypothetical protein SDC9_114157 [bioreactor metagenome]|uniref:Uncharacterized protein n=1 Tax=bioreactor metagenome TaxID=1076179 RepID=A0A645BPC5_9ZZZZ
MIKVDFLIISQILVSLILPSKVCLLGDFWQSRPKRNKSLHLRLFRFAKLINFQEIKSRHRLNSLRTGQKFLPSRKIKRFIGIAIDNRLIQQQITDIIFRQDPLKSGHILRIKRRLQLPIIIFIRSTPNIKRPIQNRLFDPIPEKTRAPIAPGIPLPAIKTVLRQIGDPDVLIHIFKESKSLKIRLRNFDS